MASPSSGSMPPLLSLLLLLLLILLLLLSMSSGALILVPVRTQVQKVHSGLCKKGIRLQMSATFMHRTCTHVYHNQKQILASALVKAAERVFKSC